LIVFQYRTPNSLITVRFLYEICHIRQYFDVSFCQYKQTAKMTDAKFLIALGRKIKEIRTKKGLSQTFLASKCNFEKASMSRIESGKTNVTVLTLKKICSALDIEVIDLFKI